MKIEKIETWLVSKWLTVRVTCDDGTYGVGEGNFWSYADATEVIAHRIEDDIKGLDPRDVDRIWNTAYRKYSFRSPAITAVLSAIDIALWDIKGKRLGAPVWDLLGGKVRNKVRAMVMAGSYPELGPFSTPEDFAKFARKGKKDGYTSLKMTPFPPNWAQLAHGDLIRQNTAIVEAVREEVGWDFDIGIEIHRNLHPGSSIVFAQQIEKFLPYFYEDPIAPDSVMSMGSVGDKINLPLAAGERNNTLWEFREYCTLPGMSFLKPDIGLAGGFTHVKKIAALAEGFHIKMAPHHFLGPITTMALVHIATATPNWDVNEFNVETGTFKEDIVSAVTAMKDGYFIPPEAPGLGIDINVEEMLKYPYEGGTGESSRKPDGGLVLG
ncbi:MAG: mandelate racemase/muconate lactonizing enzyme family protein, partial [Dehalococcoidia bacterium]|jgi:galactonate dehydratase|nr:mandelate racemase/muconate lactonizing enzyme family protein [Dehalococcoidia bacterium]MDP7089877.1 mandelate racemase/muconate lactonizing enzyme family protein [Dehalococcoidia bacterium]MDP7262864.1 mandelate racemase/muconate lactonizing enzyme family protein [Dehalococcoidia bacterium]MDP7485436.1 mandelate racemase/muconate lactonizing enzyme family protein [Dehalococcoidia bacterium]|tara:strand:- start:11424 stop:12566 length:1143 start_codon:yes stop_codon:yes gene_type:complete